MLHDVLHQVVFFMGLTAPDKWPYLFWSGIGSDLTKFAIIWVIIRRWEQRAADSKLLPPVPRRKRKPPQT